MAVGDFTLAGITTVASLISHLLTVSASNFQTAAKNAKYFAYDGFNATEILSAFLRLFLINSSDAEALSDLCDIVSIGLTRGNIREDQLERTSAVGKARITDLVKKYNIVMRKNRNDKVNLGNSTLTFTRAVSVFPYVASQLLAVGSCITEPNGCIFGTDELPSAFKHSGFASLIPIGNEYGHVLFQCFVAYMISFSKKINPNNKDEILALYTKQKQFSMAAWTNLSVCNQNFRVTAIKNLGLDSHSKFGQLYLKIANNLRKAINEPEITMADLVPFVVADVITIVGTSP